MARWSAESNDPVADRHSRQAFTIHASQASDKTDSTEVQTITGAI